MKKMLALIFIGLFFVGCANGLQLKDTAVQKTAAYASGKGVGASMYSLAPSLGPPLEESWTDMMADPSDPMPSAQVMDFYNECLFGISQKYSDPYGLIGDLGVFLMLFGAEYSPDGNMVFIQPVPRPLLNYFEFGYRSGKNAILRPGKKVENPFPATKGW